MLLLFLISYLIGSIPSGYWLAKYLFKVDVTKVGSGNIGATNVARVLGDKKYFFLVFFLDFIKAYITLFMFSLHVSLISILFLCSVFLLLGNGCSIFLKFRGGKGVATMLGILAFLYPSLFFGYVVLWGFIVVLSRKVGIASIVGVLALLPMFFLLYGKPDVLTLLFLFFIVIWVCVRHKNNIKNIFNWETGEV